jgi:peptidyl-prolyl cis-trans isomerase SurA
MGAMAGSALMAVLLIAAPFAAMGQEEGELVDRVIAVVEDRAVLQSDLVFEIKRILMQTNQTSLPPGEEEQITREILDGLVADLLMAVHAERKGIEVSDDQVDESVERAIEDNKRQLGGEAAFMRQLEAEGMTLEQLRAMYREKLRARMMMERIYYREIMSEIQVTEAEIRAYYRDHIEELPKRPEARTIAQILIMPSASDERKEEALGRIQELERKLDGGADFGDVARENSEDPSGKYGGSLGYVNLDDLNEPAFEAAVRQLEIGQVSDPILTRFGYHLAMVSDISDDKVLLKHILIKVESGDDDVAAAADRAEAIRNELLGGADFAEMAAQYSDDENTKNNGGMVGEVALVNLPEHLRGVLEGLDDGEIAPVVKDPKGFRIIKVLGHTAERPFLYEEARDELRRVIEQQKLQEEFKGYIDGLKEIYFVEVKGIQ